MLTFLVRTCTDNTESISIINANSKKEALQLLFDEPNFFDDDVLTCYEINTLSAGVQYVRTYPL